MTSRFEDLPLVLTVPEAADVLRVKRSAMYGAIQAGQVEAIRVGRKLRVSRATLAALLGEPDAEHPAEDGSV